MRAALAAALVVLAVTGCGGGSDRPREDPGAFMTGLVNDVAAGRYGVAWEKLYPAHQRVVTRARYMECEALTPFPGEVAGVEVLDVFDEPVSVSGQARKLDSTAVKLRVTVRRPDERFVQTFHALAVDGRWTWFLPRRRYDAYRTGGCFGSG